jgi:hypothetical protein
LQIRVIKSRAANPLASLEGAVAIAARTFGFQLIDPQEAQNFEDYIEDTGEGPIRETLWVFDDTRTAHIAGEVWTLEAFCKAFRDRDWCDDHPDHPVANLRHYHENLSAYRTHFQQHRPMVLLRRGQRVLKLRADLSPEEKNKWLKML